MHGFKWHNSWLVISQKRLAVKRRTTPNSGQGGGSTLLHCSNHLRALLRFGTQKLEAHLLLRQRDPCFGSTLLLMSCGAAVQVESRLLQGSISESTIAAGTAVALPRTTPLPLLLHPLALQTLWLLRLRQALSLSQ